MEGPISVYDIARGQLINLEVGAINAYIKQINKPKRHWTQLLGPGFVRDSIIKLMPRVQYAFE